MKKDKLESFILENKEEFELSFSGKNESWIHIQSQLKDSRPNAFSIGKKIIGMAAAVVLGLVAVWSYTQYHTHMMTMNPELASSIEFFEITENRLVQTYHTKGINLSEDIKKDLANITQTDRKSVV